MEVNDTESRGCRMNLGVDSKMVMYIEISV